MANTTLFDAEIKALHLGDMCLVSIEWKGQNSPNLQIVLERTSLSVSLLFTWVNKLSIHLRTFGPMTWDVTFARTPDGRWGVLFDFASAGVIEFECEEIISCTDDDKSFAS